MSVRYRIAMLLTCLFRSLWTTCAKSRDYYLVKPAFLGAQSMRFSAVGEFPAWTDGHQPGYQPGTRVVMLLDVLEGVLA